MQEKQNSQLNHRRHISGRHLVKSVRAKYDARRSVFQKFADWLTSVLGNEKFLALNAVFFAVWIVMNIEVLEGIIPFDPFPFGLLTMIVSLEAICLAIFVLISQNRAEQIDNLREEIDLQVDIVTEREITKVLHMLKKVAEKNGIDLSQDEELQEMLQPTDMEKIEKSLEKQIESV